MDMQIAITGRGGQGVLFLTRILSECALELGQEMIASETHGMAVRGGSVISTLKAGPFRGPLIRSGQADVMIVLDEEYVEAFTYLLSPGGTLFLNAQTCAVHPFIDASGLAVGMGFPLIANLILLGFALNHDKLFCSFPIVEKVIARISPVRFKEVNLKALQLGYAHSTTPGI